MTWSPPARRCIKCDCPLVLLRGERRQLCARCGSVVRAPKATQACATEGCIGAVYGARSVSGLCVACRASRTAQRVRVDK